jgi:molybdate transport system substrate-binding protein
MVPEYRTFRALAPDCRVFRPARRAVISALATFLPDMDDSMAANSPKASQSPSVKCRAWLLSVAFFLLFINVSVHAAEVKAAVAANFTAAIAKLQPIFEKQTGHKLLPSFGATGQLYAQIGNGAPFDVFLSADTQAPQKLLKEGKAVTGTDFIYARGELALWSAQRGYVDDKGEVLKRNRFAHIAIANPDTAPYGAAAVQTLKKLGLYDSLKAKFVQGDNIAQTQLFVASKNAELGFVALAQVLATAEADRGSWWQVPADMHDPVDQQAVLLKTAEKNAAASAFLKFLKTPQAIAVIRELGYTTPAP